MNRRATTVAALTIATAAGTAFLLWAPAPTGPGARIDAAWEQVMTDSDNAAQLAQYLTQPTLSPRDTAHERQLLAATKARCHQDVDAYNRLAADPANAPWLPIAAPTPVDPDLYCGGTPK